MFGWLFKKAVSPINPWPGPYSTLYIAAFRKELDNTAEALSEYGYPNVSTYFNGKTNVVDFYDKNGVVAQVAVHGECGRPYEIFVLCDIPEAKALFVNFFPNLVVTIKSLAD